MAIEVCWIVDVLLLFFLLDCLVLLILYGVDPCDEKSVAIVLDVLNFGLFFVQGFVLFVCFWT